MLMATTAAAFPFIEVRIDTSGLAPVSQRAPGVIAIVGTTPDGTDGGTAAVNTPFAVDTLDQAADLFARRNTDGTIAETPLFRSIALAKLQDPAPSKVYGVRVDGDAYAAALAGLEAADDVTFVSLAEETDVGAEATDTAPASGLQALKAHVEGMSSEGQKRLGVAMIDPTTAKSASYVADVAAAVASLKSDSSRMVVLAARGADGDVATAAMAVMAGFEPQVSIVLKRIRGIRIPTEQQFSPSEIKGLSEEQIIPVIDPALVPGEGLHFAEGRCFTTDESLLYVDVVRVLDDIDFRLKAGLIGSVGDARITKAGLTSVKIRVEGILGPLQRRAVIDGFDVSIPVLDILGLPESARTPTDDAIVVEARQNRTVDLFLGVTYGPAVHRLKVTLAPKF
jgi:hypothetical protein